MPTNTSHSLIQALQQRLLDSQELAKAAVEAKYNQLPLLQYLIHEKKIPTTTIAKTCADYFGLEYVNLTQYPHHHLALFHFFFKREQ